MTENTHETSDISNQQTTGFVSHARRLSTIPKHQNNNIGFMPKFFIKNLQRKKQHHRQPSIIFPPGIINPADLLEKGPGSSVDHETRGKPRKSNQLVSKNVGAIMSAILFRKKKKSSDKDCSLVKQGSVSAKCLPPKLSTLFRDKKLGLKAVKGKEGEEVITRDKSSAVRSLSKRTSVEVKSGLKIKGLARIKSAGKDGKRFELCKKKILMGEKCRPLNGTLRYDKNGVLVPEDLT